MTKLTASQVANILHVTPREVGHLVRAKHLKGEKIDPSKKNSPYLFSEREIKRYQQAPKSRGRTAKRCEPCNHQPKKLCISCERPICLKDYRLQAKTKLPSAKCKDCEYKRKLEMRNAKL